MIHKLLSSRTVWFSIFLAALSVVQGFVGIIVLDPIAQMIVGIVIAVAIVILRIVTTQPILEK